MLRSLEIDLLVGEYCFVTVLEGSEKYNDNALADWKSDIIMSFMEAEGLTLIMRRDVADEGMFAYSGTYRVLTLITHTSFDSVGLSSFVSSVLSDASIPAKMVSAFHHEHLLVPADDAERARELLRKSAHTFGAA